MGRDPVASLLKLYWRKAVGSYFRDVMRKIGDENHAIQREYPLLNAMPDWFIVD